MVHLRLKVYNKNDMDGSAFWADFASLQPGEISPAAGKDSTAIPPPIFFLLVTISGMLYAIYFTRN